MALSDAHKEAYARADVNVRHLVALTLTHSAFGGDIRLVNYTSNISVGGSTFTATAMEIREPAVTVESSNTVSINIDGISGQLQPLLYDAAQTPDPVWATIQPFGYNISTGSTLGVVGTLVLQMESASVTAENVVLRCGVSNSANQPFPSINYTPESHSGLF